MKNLLKSILLSSMLFMTNITAATNTQDVENFVSRFYTEVLGRTADAAGLADWTNRLVTGESAGSDVATGFVFSQEFINKNTDDTTFLNILYSAFFNRTADAGGLAGWLDQLTQGTSREDVLNGFLYSTEFSNLAAAYGIKAVPDGSSPSTGGSVEEFVSRFYSVVLGRTADAGGLADWVNRLNTKVATGADIATGFVFSAEFDEASKDDVTFLNVLYSAFFNRAADEGGLNGWLSQLEQGTSREDVLNGFLHSDEFVALCDSYGILAYTQNLSELIIGKTFYTVGSDTTKVFRKTLIFGKDGILNIYTGIDNVFQERLTYEINPEGTILTINPEGPISRNNQITEVYGGDGSRHIYYELKNVQKLNNQLLFKDNNLENTARLFFTAEDAKNALIKQWEEYGVDIGKEISDGHFEALSLDIGKMLLLDIYVSKNTGYVVEFPLTITDLENSEDWTKIADNILDAPVRIDNTLDKYVNLNFNKIILVKGNEFMIGITSSGLDYSKLNYSQSK